MTCCGGGMWMMWLWAILLVALLVGGVIAVRVLWNRFGSDQRSSGEGGALEVLEERYARGEIGRAEFERRRDALSSEWRRERA